MINGFALRELVANKRGVPNWDWLGFENFKVFATDARLKTECQGEKRTTQNQCRCVDVFNLLAAWKLNPKAPAVRQVNSLGGQSQELIKFYGSQKAPAARHVNSLGCQP